VIRTRSKTLQKLSCRFANVFDKAAQTLLRSFDENASAQFKLLPRALRFVELQKFTMGRKSATREATSVVATESPRRKSSRQPPPGRRTLKARAAVDRQAPRAIRMTRVSPNAISSASRPTSKIAVEKCGSTQSVVEFCHCLSHRSMDTTSAGLTTS
jgi:hypothetical protein